VDVPAARITPGIIAPIVRPDRGWTRMACMTETNHQIRCQRCDTQMEMKDPAPGGAWTPEQFWVCPRCGRHFWTTYPPPKAAEPKAPPPAPAAG
jgi:hypothetical protein